jgi:hypothetical protein
MSRIRTAAVGAKEGRMVVDKREHPVATGLCRLGGRSIYPIAKASNHTSA